MSICFRVRAHPFDGEDFIRENFDARSDADKFYESLQSTEDNILESTPYTGVLIELDEFCHGEWVAVSKKLVGVR